MRISGVTYVPRKTHRARNIFVAVLLLVLLAAVAVLSISVYIGWKILHPEKQPIDAISSNIAPEFQEMTFYGKDTDLPLSGWYFAARGSDKTVILAHSYGGNRLQFKEQTFNMVKAFLDQEYNVFSFDFRNSGKSAGDKTTLGYYEKEDLLGAVAKAKALGSRKTVLLGFSMGATASILAASESGDVSAVVADSPYSSLESFLGLNLAAWGGSLPPIPFNKTVGLSIQALAGIDIDRVSPVKAVEYLAPRPLLIIRGRDDTVTPSEDVNEIYSLYSGVEGARAELWQVDGAGHLEAYTKAPADYMDRVLTFLREGLSDE